jgi:hypothetical protein
MAYTGIWDGFDHYDLTKEVWDITNNPNGNNLNYGSAYSRLVAAPNCVAKGLKVGGTGVGGAYKVKNLAGNFTRYYVGLAFSMLSAPGTTFGFLGFRDAGTYQGWISINSAGAIEVHYGGTGALIGSSPPGTIGFGQYYWMDVDVTISGSASLIKIYLSAPAGSSALISVTGPFQTTGNAYLNQILIGDINAPTGPPAMYFDDFHCHDFGGGAPNTILGEGTRIYSKLPNAAGGSALWTPNGAAANWQCVDEAIPDDDTTYVAASTAVKDNYAVGAASFTGTVNGLVRRSRVRKDDGLAHTFQNGVRSSGIDALAAAYTVQSGYAYTDGYTIIDPNTGSAFTAANADLATPTILETS